LDEGVDQHPFIERSRWTRAHFDRGAMGPKSAIAPTKNAEHRELAEKKTGSVQPVKATSIDALGSINTFVQ
jgi:hypothetical protein